MNQAHRPPLVGDGRVLAETSTPAGESGFRNVPYWWDDAAFDPWSECGRMEDLPRRVDVAVIGGGYTGLSAALTLARAGRSVALLDAEAPGFGASSRNGGLVGPSFHWLGVAGMKARYGEQRTHAILSQSMDMLHWFLEFIERERIDCRFMPTGRFRGADRPEHYEALARELEELRAAVGLEAEMVPREQQHHEIGSEYYHGGIVYHRDGHLQPARLAQGLMLRAREAGARLVAGAPVTALERAGRGWRIRAGDSDLDADAVLLATNGYTGKPFRWFRRRVLWMRSAIIATEPLHPELMEQISPQGRGFGGTSRLIIYSRPSPDGRRLVFGGRSFDLHDRPVGYVPDLRRLMLRIFPQLEGAAITHGWSGRIAYTFDHVPHIGEHDGIHYAMGYCGSGVSRSSWFGHKAACKLLGLAEGRTAFDDLPFESRPLYSGYPWFLPPILRWHGIMDRMGR